VLSHNDPQGKSGWRHNSMSRLAVAYAAMLMRSRRALGHWAAPRSEGHRPALRRRLLRYLIPVSTEWVRVQQGYARGLWIRIDLASERSWWAGTHEWVVQGVLEQIVTEDTVFYDIGAHIGFFSLPAARKGAEVIAFEADPENATRLRAHADRNQLNDRLDIVEAAVWSDSVLSITFRKGVPCSQGGVAYGKHEPMLATGQTIRVRATTLDEFVSCGGPKPQIIKVDVEGSASEVLKGAVETIGTSRPILIIEVHDYSEYEAVLQFLESLCYDTLWDVPLERFPRHCFASCDHAVIDRCRKYLS
jgi:FkbM family methyltransferase